MDNLHSYLHDHLAGADLALKMLDALSKHHTDEVTSALAASLLPEIKEDRDTLGRLAESAGSGSNLTKELAAWVGSKALRVSLSPESGDPFDIFQVLEFLVTGVFGKMLLWRALEFAAEEHATRAGLDLQQLIARAEDQRARLDKLRLELAAKAFS